MKNLFKISLCAMGVILSSGAMAATGTGHAQAELSTPLGVTSVQSLNFGTIAIDPAAGTQTVSRTVALNCPAAYVCSGGDHLGHMIVTGTPTVNIDLTISTATVSDGAGTTRLVTPTFADGSTSIATGNQDGSTDIWIRGSIEFDGTEVAGTYNTTNAGGSPYVLTAIY